MNSTLIDLPREIIREIALLVDARDMIALRQVHRSFHTLPVRIPKDFPGLKRVDTDTIIHYPEIYSFTVFDRRMEWFFGLESIYPGYHNIRQLEITLTDHTTGQFPRGLEELHIQVEKIVKTDFIRIDLSPLKKLRVLTCSDDGVVFFNIPPDICRLEVDITNIPDLRAIPRGLHRLKIGNLNDSDVIIEGVSVTDGGGMIEGLDFLEFTDLEELAVFTDLRGVELPGNLKRVTCAGVFGVEAGDVYSVVMERPDRSIPWDPRIHLVDLGCALDDDDLTEFVNLDSLTIMSTEEGGNNLPQNLRNLTVTGENLPSFRNLPHLSHLYLREVNVAAFYPWGMLSSGITHLNLEKIIFPGYDSHINLSGLTNLIHIKIHMNQLLAFDNEELFLASCDLSKNQKLEQITMICVRVTGPISRSVTDIDMRECRLDSSLAGLDRLKHLTLYNVQMTNSTIPLNLETIDLIDIRYPDGHRARRQPIAGGLLPPVSLSKLCALKTLLVSGINLTGPLPDTITKLSIVNHTQDLDLFHLRQLKSLTINTWTQELTLMDRTKFVGPLPRSLRHLDIISTTKQFNLRHLHNLQSLHIYSSNKSAKGPLPPSIRVLVTDENYDITKQFLPNLREHRRDTDFF